MSIKTSLLVAFLVPGLAWAQENPGGPEDDSYIDPETLTHRAGYNRRADLGSAANTINQLEEDDRLKDPIIRFPAFHTIPRAQPAA